MGDARTPARAAILSAALVLLCLTLPSSASVGESFRDSALFASAGSDPPAGGPGGRAGPDSLSGPASVLVVPLENAVGPVTARFVCGGIERGEEDGSIVVIVIDTPGGLDTSMRQIVKAILGATVPVICYVYPSGARAASAGMFITIAAPIAAMAPGTNLGAATPVSLGGEKPSSDSTMTAKVTNDAAAYARSLAERTGRNAAWVEKAVRNAASLPAEEALADSVIDLVCADLPELLNRVDGRRVRTAAGEVVLNTRGARIQRLGLSGRERLLSWITDPSIAYLLFLAGILGLALELYHPGAVLPGVVGGISLILAFFAFQSLPVQAAGILLILLAVVLFILEVKVTSYGVLSIGGIVSLVLGSLMLFPAGSDFRVSTAAIAPAVIVFAGFFLLAAFLAARAHRRPKQGGAEGMVGMVGKAVTGLSPEGKVLVRGEYWNARSSSPVRAGEEVRILRLEGLVLVVERAGGEADVEERSR